jgi:hypothetical protein
MLKKLQDLVKLRVLLDLLLLHLFNDRFHFIHILIAFFSLLSGFFHVVIKDSIGVGLFSFVLLSFRWVFEWLRFV